MAEYIEFCSGLTENPEIVKALKDSIIKKIVRVCNPYMLDYFVNEKGVSGNNIFNTLPGTILFFMENEDVIGFSIDDNKISIVSWYSVHDGIEFNTEHYIRELDFNYIPYNDPLYSNSGNWTNIIGHKIIKISVIDHDDGKYRRDFKDSFQRAVIFETAKDDLVLSYLPERGASLPLIRKSQIPKEILDNSKIIEL